MGFSSLPKVGVPSLPVVLLFGKMKGERGEQNGVGTQLESVQKVWEGRGGGIVGIGGVKGCSKEVLK